MSDKDYLGAFNIDWQPLSLEELKILFANSKSPYWISGGWAIDLFVGKHTRPHGDLDISIPRSELASLHNTLKGWDLQICEPNSKAFRPFLAQEKLESPYYNIWSRKKLGGAWNLQILISDFESSEWVYRRNEKIRGPISEFGWTAKDGSNVLSPVIQLLYKSRDPREKDIQDLNSCLPFFTPQQKERLSEMISFDSGEDHPWLQLLELVRL